MSHSDSGKAMQARCTASTTIEVLEFDTETRQLSVRNTGVSTLWFTFTDPATGKAVWFDVACGTSWDDRVITKRMWFCTQLGKTSFVATGVRLSPEVR